MRLPKDSDPVSRARRAGRHGPGGYDLLRTFIVAWKEKFVLRAISTEFSKRFSLGEQRQRQAALCLTVVSLSAGKSQRFSVLLPWKPTANTVGLIFLNTAQLATASFRRRAKGDVSRSVPV